MGYHTFAVGETLSASNVMSFLMNQTLIVCTSGSRPGSPVAGMHVYETDTAQISIYTGSVWVNLLAKSATTLAGSSSTTTSATFADLAAGAATGVTITTGTIVHITVCSYLVVSPGAGTALCGVAINGTVPANDNEVLENSGTTPWTSSMRIRHTGLTAGSNTFKPVFRVTGGATLTAGNICIIVECVPA